MCGICGIWGSSSPGVIEKMVQAQHHRGPDDHGIYRDESVSLGMARLAVIDLSSAAHQPMGEPGGKVWIIFNGEIFNFQEERNLLISRGYSFSSKSDTEVALWMYLHYGDDFLLRLRGMFALAIYDKRGGRGKERLLLARDPIGIKPLLYSWVGDRLIFASELKSMLASGLIRPRIDPEALRLLLTFGSVYQPRTILSAVRMLPPAYRLIVQGKKERLERYWIMKPGRVKDTARLDYPEQVERVAAALGEAVRFQMISDVPLGAFLSGGVDSSLLVGLMSQVSGKRLKTFSVGFQKEGAALDESDEAGRTAHLLGTDHHRVVIRGSDVRDNLSHIAWSLDQPSVDGVNSYFVSMAARREVTVSLSGTGGDELFAGYPWFANMVRFETKRVSPVCRLTGLNRLRMIGKRFLIHPLLSGGSRRLLSMFHGSSGFLSRYAENYQIFGPEGTARILSPEIAQEAGEDHTSANDLLHFDEMPQAGTVDRVSGLCLRAYTSNQLLRDIDAVSMAHSLEVRVPFLDVPLLNLVLSLPSSAKIGDVEKIDRPHLSTYRESGCKRILIDAGKLMKVLPPGIEDQLKRGFSLPMDDWLKAELREPLENTLSRASVKARGFFDPEVVEGVKQGFMEGRIHWTRPWLLMLFELWCREILDLSPPSIN
jgi:asparagine synthase (glutamine-hydrolysing)